MQPSRSNVSSGEHIALPVQADVDVTPGAQRPSTAQESADGGSMLFADTGLNGNHVGNNGNNPDGGAVLNVKGAGGYRRMSTAMMMAGAGYGSGADVDTPSVAGGDASSPSAMNPTGSGSLTSSSSAPSGGVAGGGGAGHAGPATSPLPERPRFRLVLMVVAENEESVPESEWLRFIDSACPDFELHVNLSRPRWSKEVAMEAFPRVTFGRLTPQRLERLLPPAGLLAVALSGAPVFCSSLREMLTNLGLPRSLVRIVA